MTIRRQGGTLSWIKRIGPAARLSYGVTESVVSQTYDIRLTHRSHRRHRCHAHDAVLVATSGQSDPRKGGSRFVAVGDRCIHARCCILAHLWACDRRLAADWLQLGDARADDADPGDEVAVRLTTTSAVTEIKMRRSRLTINQRRPCGLLSYAARSTRVSISPRSAPKSMGLVKRASAPASNSLRLVSPSP